MFRTRYLTFALALLLAGTSVLATTAELRAETKPKISDVGIDGPKSFLFVGNSFMFYNNGMRKQFTRLAQAADTENSGSYRGTSVTISGAGLSWHDMESYFRPAALAQYSFVSGNKVRFNEFEKLFDVVVMMDCSQCPVHPQLNSTFHEYVAKHSKTIVKNGARPVLMMTWAYEDRPEMTAALAEEYTVAGNANDILVAPSGLAFAKARSRRPEIKLYQPDKRHPSLAGTYLSALTIYSAIYKESPAGMAAADGIDADTAAFLQEVAWDTVLEFFDE
jgi:hypothetical protein